MALNYGFDEAKWRMMATAGYDHLQQVAARGLTTTYPEFCAQVFDRAGLRIDPTDAALGGLLAEVARRSMASTGVILPAVLVSAEKGQPGAGFFTYAVEVGMLPKRAKQEAKFIFWAEHMKAVFAAYSTR